MAAILSLLLHLRPDDPRIMTVFQLARFPSELLDPVVSLLFRLVFEFGLWSGGTLPVLLVCEEAHRYINADRSVGFRGAREGLSRIAKEGRKYGVSLCVISQRPSDLATDMLSECNTMFALRMSNQADQELVQATMAEAGLGLLEFLPSLHTGEAIVIGEGVPVPQRVIFSPLAAHDMPRSKTFVFSEAWSQDSGTAEPVASIVERWRHLQKGSTRQQTRREPGPRAQAAAAAANAQGTMQPAATLQMPPQTQRPTGT
jgi:hypothetical protein